MGAIIICGDTTIFYQFVVILDFFWWRIFILPVYIENLEAQKQRWAMLYSMAENPL